MTTYSIRAARDLRIGDGQALAGEEVATITVLGDCPIKFLSRALEDNLLTFEAIAPKETIQQSAASAETEAAGNRRKATG